MLRRALWANEYFKCSSVSVNPQSVLFLFSAPGSSWLYGSSIVYCLTSWLKVIIGPLPRPLWHERSMSGKQSSTVPVGTKSRKGRPINKIKKQICSMSDSHVSHNAFHLDQQEQHIQSMHVQVWTTEVSVSLSKTLKPGFHHDLCDSSSMSRGSQESTGWIYFSFQPVKSHSISFSLH